MVDNYTLSYTDIVTTDVDGMFDDEVCQFVFISHLKVLCCDPLLDIVWGQTQGIG